MTNSFLTLEDINGALYSNQGFFWHEIDTAKISVDNNFTNIKYDFVTVSRTTGEEDYIYDFVVDNSYFTKGYLVLNSEGNIISPGTIVLLDGNRVHIVTDEKGIKLLLYMGIYTFNNLTFIPNHLESDVLDLNLEELNTSQTVRVLTYDESQYWDVPVDLVQGYNLIEAHNSAGYLLVNLIKSDFQFTCNQELIVGKVNKVALGTNAKYKPSGAMIGNNTPNITVEYNNNIIPVTWSESDNDYIFNIDLTTKQNEGNVRFKVIVEDNQVVNKTETYVSLHCSYEAINTISKLTTLFTNGGIGRITSNLTLTDDLTLSKSVYLISDGKTLTMDSHKIIVPSDKTFKATNVNFTGGANTIQQNINTKVELTQCTFTDCTGLGSVIDCQIDINSLNNEDDFTTIINNCTFTNNDLCILHGGDLTITDCTVNGKISDKDYPYFLYQTDGRAVILQSQFNISSNTQITSDIGFNPCIFTCGETALINGHSHTELQVNNLTSFLETQRNTSSIDLTYKYSLINDYIRLKTSKGFCHNVSGIDYVFKTNVTPERI